MRAQGLPSRISPRARYAARLTCPPVVWIAITAARNRGWLPVPEADRVTAGTTGGQDLDAYWDPEYAKILDTWGDGNVWAEIPLLLWAFEGPVLDIACGTGKTMESLEPLQGVKVYGCDISDLLIDKAAERGIARERLEVCDARDTPYADGHFAAFYSIGSLEHFPDDTIPAFLRECRRVTRGPTFHQIPVASSGRDEGWIRQSHQSFHNNSVSWWLERFRAVYPTVSVLDSTWRGGPSVGRWFICAP